MYSRLPEILLIVSESPLAWSAFVIFLIVSFFVKFKLGKAEKLTRQIRHLPPQDRLKAIEMLYGDVHGSTPESYLKAKRQKFRFFYYLSTLLFLIATIWIGLFYINKIVPALLPFMPPPVKIVRETPESGAIKSNLQGYVDFKRFLIDFQGCTKEASSSISCMFTVENKSGDKEFGLTSRQSRIVEKSGDELPCNSVKISNDDFSSSSSTELISGIPTSAVYLFDGVADDVNSVAALEAQVTAEGDYLTLQYKNIPLQ
jgi:hypothetical protein